MTNDHTCIACGFSLTKFGQVDGVEILKCSKCGLGSTINISIQKNNYHRDETYIAEQKLFKNIFQRRVNAIQSLHSLPGKVLEIGSSTGLLLSLFLDSGWDVLGVEISKPAANFAIKKGIKTITESFEKFDFNKEKFDVIIINHTLEHLQNPNEIIEKAYQVLNKGGLLLIDVPNFDSFWARVFGMRWSLLLPNEHIWHFTKDSLNRILSSRGFEVIYTVMPSGLFDLANPLKEIWIALTSTKKRLFSELLMILPDFILTNINRGNDLTVIAQKI